MADFDFGSALDAIDTSPAETGVDVPLFAPNGKPLVSTATNADGQTAVDPTPISLRLLGTDSDTYRTHTRKATRDRMVRAQKRKGDDLPTDEDMDAAEAAALDLIVALTVGWKGVLDSKGKPVKFSKDAVRALYLRYPIAREQAEAAVSDRARFTKASSNA